MTPPVLVVNAGSSTLKLSVLDDRDDPVAATVLDGDDAHDRERLAAFVHGAGEVGAVGHRVVHGGADHTAPTLVTAEVADRLRALVPLAPLHQPAALAALDAVTGAAAGGARGGLLRHRLPRHHPTPPAPTPSRRRGGSGWRCAASASTACPMPGRPPGRAPRRPAPWPGW